MASNGVAFPDQPRPEIGEALVIEFEALLRRAAERHRLAELRDRALRGANTMAYEQIGEAAGTVWQSLAQSGPRPLGVLIQDVNVPESLFFMAVGWLSREGKLEFEPTDGDYTVSLR